VLVDPVVGDLTGPGVHGAVVVVAILVVPVSIAVDVVIGRGRIAVVVLAVVRGLGQGGRDAGVVVVEERRVGQLGVYAVAVRVGHVGAGAVLVDAVVGNLRGPGVDVGVVVVAIGVVVDPVAVQILVLGGRIAVVILAVVRGLGHAGMDAGVG